MTWASWGMKTCVLWKSMLVLASLFGFMSWHLMNSAFFLTSCWPCLCWEGLLYMSRRLGVQVLVLPSLAHNRLQYYSCSPEFTEGISFLLLVYCFFLKGTSWSPPWWGAEGNWLCTKHGGVGGSQPACPRSLRVRQPTHRIQHGCKQPSYSFVFSVLSAPRVWACLQSIWLVVLQSWSFLVCFCLLSSTCMHRASWQWKFTCSGNALDTGTVSVFAV